MEQLRNTVLFLEKKDVTLADCFIMLVRLAAKINKMSCELGIIGFKNNCIKVMNTRWESFDINPYILTYWLHPAYRGKFNNKS